MSTLSLEDLGPKMRRELGLEAPCRCAGRKTNFVATIPVIEAGSRRAFRSASNDPPGAAWLRTGLHRLRIPVPQPPTAIIVDPDRREDFC